MRLIDPDKVIAVIEKIISEKSDSELYVKVMRCVCNMLDESPVEDAAPVVHGYWIEDTERHIFGRKKNDLCSNCRTYTGIVKFNYCPNCGAKMDLEREVTDDV